MKYSAYLNEAGLQCSMTSSKMHKPHCLSGHGLCRHYKRDTPLSFDYSDECGAGVLTASHFDRHYCGKCCLTYCFNKPEVTVLVNKRHELMEQQQKEIVKKHLFTTGCHLTWIFLIQ